MKRLISITAYLSLLLLVVTIAAIFLRNPVISALGNHFGLKNLTIEGLSIGPGVSLNTIQLEAGNFKIEIEKTSIRLNRAWGAEVQIKNVSIQEQPKETPQKHNSDFKEALKIIRAKIIPDTVPDLLQADGISFHSDTIEFELENTIVRKKAKKRILKFKLSHLSPNIPCSGFIEHLKGKDSSKDNDKQIANNLCSEALPISAEYQEGADEKSLKIKSPATKRLSADFNLTRDILTADIHTKSVASLELQSESSLSSTMELETERAKIQSRIAIKTAAGDLHAEIQASLPYTSQAPLLIQKARITGKNIKLAVMSARQINVSSSETVEWAWNELPSPLKITVSAQDMDVKGEKITFDNLQVSVVEKTLKADFSNLVWQPLKTMFKPVSGQIEVSLSEKTALVNGAMTSGILPVNLESERIRNLSDLQIKLTTPELKLTAENPLSNYFNQLPVPLEINTGLLDAAILIIPTSPFVQISVNSVSTSGTLWNFPFKGLSGKINFPDLSTMKSHGPLTFDSVTTPVPLKDGSIKLQMKNLSDKLEIILPQGSAKLFGGDIHVSDISILPYVKKKQKFLVEIERLDLSQLMLFAGQDQDVAEGRVNISLPIVMNGTEINIEDGKLKSVGPGRIAIPRNETGNKASDLAMKALENFTFSQLEGAVFYKSDGELLLKLSIQGKNKEVLKGQEFKFNINLEQNLLKLLKSVGTLQTNRRFEKAF